MRPAEIKHSSFNIPLARFIDCPVCQHNPSCRYHSLISAKIKRKGEVGTQCICLVGQIFPRILWSCCVYVWVSLFWTIDAEKTTIRHTSLEICCVIFKLPFLISVILYCAEVCLLSSRDGLTISISKRERLSHKTAGTAKRRYSERIESHFQLNDSWRMWQGLKTICSSGNNNSVEVRADPLLAVELNNFYGRFECNGGTILPISTSASSRQSSDDHVFTVSEDDVRRELRRVNVRKAAGPDGITGRVLRSCADQLAGLFTSIFNESLATSVVPTPFKKSVIIPVPKNSKPSCLNDYRPVALTSTVMKVFERLLKKHICSSIPATLDPLQFAYRPNRSTDDAISQVLHSSLTHIDSKNGNMSGCYSLTIAPLSIL